jgi:hypothetical protein
MDKRSEIISLSVFIILVILILPSVIKDIKRLIKERDFYKDIENYMYWTFPEILLCIGGALALVRLIFILITHIN